MIRDRFVLLAILSVGCLGTVGCVRTDLANVHVLSSLKLSSSSSVASGVISELSAPTQCSVLPCSIAHSEKCIAAARVTDSIMSLIVQQAGFQPYVSVTGATDSNLTADVKLEEFILEKNGLRCATGYIRYRTQMVMNAKWKSGPESQVRWGQTVKGIMQNENWLKVGDKYLPIVMEGHQILRPVNEANRLSAQLSALVEGELQNDLQPLTRDYMETLRSRQKEYKLKQKFTPQTGEGNFKKGRTIMGRPYGQDHIKRVDGYLIPHSFVTENGRDPLSEKLKIEIYDNVQGETVTDLEFYPNAGLAKLAFIEKTLCSMSGSPLLEWLIMKVREMGFHTLELEDDSRVECPGTDINAHTEAPLRILRMLRADSPEQGEGFYESRGFRHVHPQYQASKKVLNMKMAELKVLVFCSDDMDYHDYDALAIPKSVFKQDDLFSDEESVFNWLKRAKQNPDACKMVHAIAGLFWHGVLTQSANSFDRCRVPEFKSALEFLLGAYGEDLNIFSSSWRKMVFKLQL